MFALTSFFLDSIILETFYFRCRAFQLLLKSIVGWTFELGSVVIQSGQYVAKRFKAMISDALQGHRQIIMLALPTKIIKWVHENVF